ncbi:MAG: NAD(+) synthase [Chthoniobacteraceae bacterium]
MTHLNAAIPLLLARLRASRGFDAAEVAEAKCGRLARWFAHENLNAAVVGVSGGVDSAVVLALLRQLQLRGVLRRVVALLLPVDARGATEQETALTRGRLAADAFDVEIWEAPLTEAHAATVEALSRGSALAFDAWSEGQLLSVMRTPALYGAAALLQAHGYRSLVVGTTNRDEGSFLGFFGKSSDGMVDLQPISDLHKSEVRALARHFGVPAAIVDAAPSGNVHDGRCDEEMIGASYDEVELFLRLRELELDPSPVRPRALAAIERQHAVNQHKYRVGNPSVHLDVMPRGVPGGWPDEALSPRVERRPPPGVVPGAWDPPSIELEPAASVPEMEAIPVDGLAIRVRQALTPRDCERLRAAFATADCAAPVGVTGMCDGHGIGSQRATAWSPDLSCALWRKLAPVVPSVRFLDQYSPTDGFATPTRAGHRSWRVVGLSPLLRFMRYDRGGRHFAHYDAGFDYGDGRRTLLSVVFYLSDACESGATRFVRDGQSSKPVSERDFSDWERETRDDEVAVAVHPKTGDALVFDHRLCHDVQRWDGSTPRIIVRADVVYEVIPDDRT